MINIKGNVAYVHPHALGSIDEGYDDEAAGLKFIEDLGWEVGHKMQSRAVVFQHADTGKFYMYEMNRQGDDFKGYEHLSYMDNKDSEGRIACDEVIKEQVVTHVWKGVK